MHPLMFLCTLLTGMLFALGCTLAWMYCSVWAAIGVCLGLLVFGVFAFFTGAAVSESNF
jgi:hypothetical protein